MKAPGVPERGPTGLRKGPKGAPNKLEKIPKRAHGEPRYRPGRESEGARKK
jgi:hypothetical protein